ncbi:MAG: hypothetical protein FWH43_08200, partial [Endomicrobia bacterium]|nr:hypothetical protein [Endomicrobiia bacterium]
FGPIKNQANFEETFEKTKVITNADGTQEFIFEDAEQEMAVDTKPISAVERVIVALARILGINLTATFISKDFPMLLGTEAVMMSDKITDESELMRNAQAISNRGMDVNILLPYDQSVVSGINEVINTGTGYIYPKSIEQANGSKITVYYYNYEGLSSEAAAVDALTWLTGEINAAIIENFTKIDSSSLYSLAPTALILNSDNGMSALQKLIAMRERVIENSGENMRNMESILREIDVAKTTDFSILNSNGVSGFLLRVSLSDFKNNRDNIRDFIAAAHAKDINVVVKLQADASSTREQITGLLADIRNGLLRDFRTDQQTGENVLKQLKLKISEYSEKIKDRGIDGLIFDFEALDAQVISGVESSLDGVAFAVRRENVDAVIGVSLNMPNAAFANNGFVNVNDKKNALNIGLKDGEAYNYNTVDPDEIASQMLDALQSGVKLIIIGDEIFEAFKNEIGFDFEAFFRGVASKWVSFLKKTPKGVFNDAKRSGLLADSNIDENAERNLYNALSEIEQMRDGLSEGKSIDANHLRASIIIIDNFARTARTAHMRQKADLLTDSQISDIELLVYEAHGYLEGLLGKMQQDKHIKAGAVYAVSTDKDSYRSLLVQARKYQLNNALLSKDTPYENFDASILAEASMRDTLNTLTALAEARTTSNRDRAIAIANLLEVWDVFTQNVEVKDTVRVEEQRAGIRAILAAA